MAAIVCEGVEFFKSFALAAASFGLGSFNIGFDFCGLFSALGPVSAAGLAELVGFSFFLFSFFSFFSSLLLNNLANGCSGLIFSIFEFWPLEVSAEWVFVPSAGMGLFPDDFLGDSPPVAGCRIVFAGISNFAIAVASAMGLESFNQIYELFSGMLFVQFIYHHFEGD